MATQVKSVFGMGAPLLGAAAGVLLACSAAAVYLVSSSVSESEAKQLKSFQANAALMVDSFLQQEDALAADVASQPAEIIVGNIPGTLSVLVVNASGEVPTNISFTDQDFLRRALVVKGDFPAEAGIQANKKLALSLIKPLKSGTGFVLVKVSLDPLLKNLKGLASNGNAGLALRQKLTKDAEPMILLEVNSHAGDVGIPTQNKNWFVAVSPPQSSNLYSLLLILMTVGSGAGLGLFAFALLKNDKRLNQDLYNLKRVSQGDELSSPLHYAVMQEVWSAMTTMKPGKSQSPKTGKPDVHTGNVSEIVEAAEALPDLMPVSKPIEATEQATVDIGAEQSPEPVPAEAVKELSLLEFTLSKGKSEKADDSQGVPVHIFRMYDIRGKAGSELVPELVSLIGKAIGTLARNRGENTVVVGRDCRLSSEELSQALIEGLSETGCDVINVGEVPTPVLNYAAKNLGTGSGVMVTGSHNPGGDNGLKIMLANHTLVGDEVKEIRELVLKADFAKGAGVVTEQSITDDYLQQISDDVILGRAFNVVVDGGNGVAGPLAVRMLEDLGCTVSALYCEPDGSFPNHDPDPTKAENLEDLLSDVAISGADLGIALDGDGDRLVIVTNSTRIIPSDHLLMLFAREILATQPGADILFDVKCSRDLVSVITTNGGRPVMTRTGHAWLKAGLEETPAPLAGEFSGHFIFCDRWQGFDDGLYAAARFLEILAQSSGTADDLFAAFPQRSSTPELSIPISEEFKFDVISRLIGEADGISDATVNTIDGLRIDWPSGWGLVRASNTGACLVARFEGNDDESLAMVKQKFSDLLARVDPMLLLPF